MSGSYCQLNLSSTSKTMLQDFMKQFSGRGKLIHAKEYHCTVMYSRVPVRPMKISTPISGRIDGYDIFDDHLLVATLRCPQAESIFETFKSRGATWDFSSFIPHITLAANWKGPLPIQLPLNTIWFDSYTFEALNTEYVY